ncbi:MAG: FAD-dependent monooxygenase [Bacilli bacterium]
MSERAPVIIVGSGPVGLCAALAFARQKIPFVILEEHGSVSTQPKAGTLMPRTLEIFAQIGVIDPVLKAGLRFDRIDFVDRESDKVLMHVDMHLLRDITSYPFVLNLPQHELEPILLDHVQRSGYGEVLFNHKLVGFSQTEMGCEVTAETPQGKVRFESDYVLGCDGSHSALRGLLGVRMEGKTYPERFIVIDTNVALDNRAGRQLTYLSYVFDPKEWIITVRQPHFWRFLFPVPEGAPDPDEAEIERKVRLAVGDLPLKILASSVYKVHHRSANRFRVGRAFLVGDAAHLITPVGGLGLNTGIGDASNLPWKISFVLKGLASPSLLETYEAERQPIARFNAQNLADRNRRYIMMKNPIKRIVRNVTLSFVERSENLMWKAAARGSLLASSYSSVKRPPGAPVLVGDRAPDGELLNSSGRVVTLHSLFGSAFIALTFADARQKAELHSMTTPALRHYLVTPIDAPHDSGIRDRSFVDLGGRLTALFGGKTGDTFLIRPDGHVAYVEPDGGRSVEQLFQLATMFENREHAIRVCEAR